MFRYEVNGTYFTITEEEKEDFLAQYPNAVEITSSDVSEEETIQGPQPPEQDISSPGSPNVIQASMGFASTEQSFAPSTEQPLTPSTEQPLALSTKKYKNIEFINEGENFIKYNVDGNYITIGRDENEEFLDSIGYDPGDMDFKSEDLPFDKRVSNDNGVSSIVKDEILGNFIRSEDADFNYDSSLDGLIQDYKEKYKNTSFEFEKTGKFWMSSDSWEPGEVFTGATSGNRKTTLQRLRVTGENGIEEIFDFENGDPTAAINKFIEANQDVEKRDAFNKNEKDIKNFFKGKLNIGEFNEETGNIDGGDNVAGSWWRTATEAYDPYWDTHEDTGLAKITSAFGAPSKHTQFANENYKTFTNFINDGNNKEDLRKYLRTEYEKSTGNRLFYKGETSKRDLDLNDIGVSDYKYDKMFEDIVGQLIAKDLQNTKDVKIFNVKEKLVEEFGSADPYTLTKKLTQEGIDYRDLPEYDELSKIYFDEAVSELTGDQKIIAATNGEVISLSKELSKLRENNIPETDKQITDLISKIKNKQKTARDLLQNYNGKNTDLFMDFTSGRIVQAKTDEEKEKFQKQNTNFRNIQTKFENYKKEFYKIKEDRDFQSLEERFNSNSLEKNEIEDYKRLKFDINISENLRFTDISGKKSEFIKKLKKDFGDENGVLKNVPMGHLLELHNLDNNILNYFHHNIGDEPESGVIKQEFNGFAELLKDRIEDNTVERKALTDVYLMNIDPADIRRTGEGKGERDTYWQDAQQFGSNMYESVVETWTEDTDTIHSESDKLAAIQQIGNELGIAWTKDQQKNFVQTTAEFTGQTLGAVPQIAAEFAILNAVTSGISSYTGLSQGLAAMRMGRVIHRGQVVNRTKLLNQVYKDLGSKSNAAVKKWLNPKNGFNRYRNGKPMFQIKGPTLGEKIAEMGVVSLIEEGKMKLMELPTGTGTAFALSGRLLGGIVGRLGAYFTTSARQGQKLFATSKYLPTIPVVSEVTAVNAINKSLKLARSGPQFAISAEFASNVEAMIEDFVGGKDMRTFVDEHYNDLELSEIERRTLGNVLTGWGFGVGHSKTLIRGVKGNGWAFTRTQMRNIQNRAHKIIIEENKKPEQDRNFDKILKYSEIIGEISKQIETVHGIYKNTTPQMLVKRAKRDIDKAVENFKSETGELPFDEVHVQEGNGKDIVNEKGKISRKGRGKYKIDGAMDIITTPDGIKILAVDAFKFSQGKIPHELGHIFKEKLGFKETDFQKIKDFIKPEVEANAKNWLETVAVRKKNGEAYKSLEELLNDKYTKANQSELLAEEYVMRVVEFFGDKVFRKAMIDGNAFKGIKEGIKSLYEGKLKETGLFEGKEIGFQDAQDVMKALQRISKGDKGVLKEWQDLKNLVQFLPTGELVNVKTNKIVGKNKKKSSFDLLMEEGLRLKEDKVRDEQIYQRTDRLWNEKYDIAKWNEIKKDPTKLETAAYEIAFTFEGNIIGRLEAKRDRGELKGFTKGEIETIAMEFITAKSGGLVSAIKAFTPSKMINPQTGKPSLATYFNSRVPNQKGSLIDVKLSKFYTEHPKFGRFFKELGEVKELVDTDAFRTEEELSNNKRFERAKIDPLNLVSYNGKNLKTNYQTAINSFYDKLSKKEKEALNLPDMKDLAPEVTAEFFGINSKKLKDFYEGKTKYIHDFTYSDKVEYTNPEGKTEIMTLDQANNKGLRYGVDVFLEPSEVTNIQKTIRRNAHELLSLLPERNVVPKESIDKKDVDPNLVGRAIGIKGKYLDFYERYTDPKALSSDPVVRKTATTTKTGRSRGKTTQPYVLRLKPEFLLKDIKAVEAFLKVHGITPPGKPNKYNKSEHGPMLTSAVRLFPKFMSVKAVGNRLAVEGLTEALNNIKAGTSKRSSSLNLFEEGFKELLEKNNKIVSEKQVLKLVNKITDPIIRRRVKVAIKDTYTIFDTNRDIAITKEARRRIEELDILETAKLEDLSISEVIKRATNAEKNYKQSYDKINNNFKLKSKDKIIYRPQGEILTSKHYKEFKKVLGDVATRLGLFDPKLGATQKMEILRGLGWNKFKVVLPNGEIGRLNNEALGFKKNVDLYKTHSEAEINTALAGFFGVKPSKSTLSNDSRQPKWDEKGLKAANKKGIALGGKEAHIDYIRDYLSTKDKSYEETIEANRYNLTENYKALFDILADASGKKGKIKEGEYKGRTELSRALELVTEYMRIQTSIADGSMKGMVPVIGVTTAPARSTTRTETKDQHNEHARELFNVNTKDMLPVFMKYLKNKEKGYKAIRKLVNTYGQILTSAESMSIKDNLSAYFKEGGKGVVGMESYNVLLNTVLARGQGDNIILLEAKGKTVNEFLREKYLPKDIEMAIKRIGDANLNAEAIKVKRTIEYQSVEKARKIHNGKILDGIVGKKSSLDLTDSEIIENIKNIDKAIELARSKNKKKKGISVLDFDDTVAKTKSKIIVNAPYYGPGKMAETTMRITPAEFAKRHAELERAGAAFDFSEFNKVIKGKKGPLFDKLEKAVNKFGNENVFILTARPQESAKAIKQFLESMGVKLKIENITGLEDGKPSAKAQWIINKAAEGYNDFYFADDAIANVKAVKKVLDIVDVKSKIQQARKSSIDLNEDINKIIEYSTGIGREKTYSAAKAGLTGKVKSHWKLYMPSRASDFHSLSNALLGKGVKGLENRKWIKENIIKPFSRGDLAFNTERRTKLADYYALRNQLKETGSKYRDMFKKNPLNNLIEKGDVWTNQHAVRIYNWAKQGTLPKDISKTDVKKLVNHVNNNPKLKAFAEELVNLHKGESYPEPSEMWLSETVTQDILLGGKKTSRDKHMKEFNENADIVFSTENLNKMEAAFGKAWRTAMENTLHSMKTGSNRPSWGEGNKWESDFLDWVNGSIGSTMFLNVRSALLQQVSLTNYINVTDNNIFAAGKAFANNNQFRKDYLELMNDPWSLNRRDGLRYNVQEAEIAELFATTKNKPVALINWALKKGFVLTKFMDSHATAFGGASFYRNRTNRYMKEGMSKVEAENKAKEEWREMSDATQQTSRMDRVSPEQKSVSGRLILPFSTVQLAYGRRYIDDAARDLINKRFDHLYKGENSALKKIGQMIYGTAIQGAIFHGLQQGIFKILFDDGNTLDGEELEVANATLDGILVGSGIAGKALTVFKNWIIKMDKERKKKNPKYSNTATEFLKISPPIDKKYRQIKGALAALQYDMDKMGELGLDNPALVATTKVIEATTNAPVNNLLINMQNVEAALEEDRANWQRPFLIGGWAPWNLEDDKKESNKSTWKGKSAFKKR